MSIPSGALIIGLTAGVVCYVAAVWVKKALGYDDSLDAWGVHGVGGALGAILTGVFAKSSINSAGKGWLADGNFHQMLIQFYDVPSPCVLRRGHLPDPQGRRSDRGPAGAAGSRGRGPGHQPAW
jgi:ammonia channel protein AmtB